MAKITEQSIASRNVSSRDTVRLVEIFSSIQGEGILVGYRQIFVRTYGCNLRCTYCDSPETLKESGTPAMCRVEERAGSWTFQPIPNPVAAEALTEIVKAYLREPHHSISITGGEPLLHAAFLERWLPSARALGLAVFIETNGMLPGHLKRLIPFVDYVSMDFKAPTATGAPLELTLQRHREFLEVACATDVTIYGKFVVTSGSTDTELDGVIDTIASVDRRIPLILQPVTPFGFELEPVSPGRMLALHARASGTLTDVRVIPQTHKMMHMI